MVLDEEALMISELFRTTSIADFLPPKWINYLHENPPNAEGVVVERILESVPLPPQPVSIDTHANAVLHFQSCPN